MRSSQSKPGVRIRPGQRQLVTAAATLALVAACAGTDNGSPGYGSGTTQTSGGADSTGGSGNGATGATSVGSNGGTVAGATSGQTTGAATGSSTGNGFTSAAGTSAGTTSGGLTTGGSSAASSTTDASTSSTGTTGAATPGTTGMAGTGAGGASATSTTSSVTTGASTTGGGGDDGYPCDGDPSGYDVVVQGSGNSWTVTGGGSYSDMASAMSAGYSRLSGSTQQTMLVLGDGDIDANAQLKMPSNMVLNICGTINVTGSYSNSDTSPLYARGRTDIDIPHATITGSPQYAMFFRDVDNLHLGQIDIRVTTGEGIRIDNHGRSDRSDKVDNIQIDDVYVQGTGAHGVETYGANNLTIGTVTARSTHYAGLMLNDSTNVEVGLVDGDDCATGTGYATLRMANRNGRVGDAYPTNVHVERVIARGGGRGIFCVSESGGAAIDHIDLEDTGLSEGSGNSILIENCYNLTIGNPNEQSRIANSADLRLAARDEFALTSDITLQNIALNGTTVTESPCATNSSFIDLTGGTLNICN